MMMTRKAVVLSAVSISLVVTMLLAVMMQGVESHEGGDVTVTVNSGGSGSGGGGGGLAELGRWTFDTDQFSELDVAANSAAGEPYAETGITLSDDDIFAVSWLAYSITYTFNAGTDATLTGSYDSGPTSLEWLIASDLGTTSVGAQPTDDLCQNIGRADSRRICLALTADGELLVAPFATYSGRILYDLVSGTLRVYR